MDWVGDLEEKGNFVRFKENRFVMSFAGTVFDMIQRSEANHFLALSQFSHASDRLFRTAVYFRQSIDL